MLKKKYFLLIFIIFIILAVLALWDLTRQNDLAEAFATKQIKQIISKETSLKTFGLPTYLLGKNLSRVDTNYTFTQWEVIFNFEQVGFVLVYVKPKKKFIIPILNFNDDFIVDFISYTKYQQNE